LYSNKLFAFTAETLNNAPAIIEQVTNVDFFSMFVVFKLYTNIRYENAILTK
jgi:hypothetical protein